jgi:hypothetical protein
MADDSSAKPPPPEITVEGEWPYFLRHPVDPGERARRAQQAADELAQQAADEQRELERKQRERENMLPAWKGKAERHQLKVDIIIKIAGTVVSPGTPKEKAWQVAGDKLAQINKHLELENRLRERDGSPCRMSHGAVYCIVRRNWSRLTSLRKRH